MGHLVPVSLGLMVSSSLWLLLAELLLLLLDVGGQA
jgi:hypothetical protein